MGGIFTSQGYLAKSGNGKQQVKTKTSDSSLLSSKDIHDWLLKALFKINSD